jgi:hypothetical protein
MANENVGWYYRIGAKEVGPMSKDKLRELVASGVIETDSKIRTEEMQFYSKAGSVPGLFDDAIVSSSTLSYLTPTTLKSVWIFSVILSIVATAYAIVLVAQSPINDQTKMGLILSCFVASIVGLVWIRILLEAATATFEIRELLKKR